MAEKTLVLKGPGSSLSKGEYELPRVDEISNGKKEKILLQMEEYRYYEERGRLDEYFELYLSNIQSNMVEKMEQERSIEGEFELKKPRRVTNISPEVKARINASAGHSLVQQGGFYNPPRTPMEIKRAKASRFDRAATMRAAGIYVQNA